MSARLRSLGFALPRAWAQDELASGLAQAWELDGVEKARWDRIVCGSTIRRRHAVGDLVSTLRMSTGERMRVYEREAPELALRAASEALGKATIDASAITDCVVVSCTGFTAPGVGNLIARRLGLRPTVRHTQVGFMGCFGGVLGLRTAVGTVAAEPGAVVLVVCVELCSLHLRADRSPENLVASAIFADGAAAAILDGERDGGIGRLTLGATIVLDEAADAMTWRIGNDGFAMTLTREVPVALERSVRPFVESLQIPTEERFAPLAHPGGPGILDAIERGLASVAVVPEASAASRAVLRDYGNMSSGSILFVLDEYLRQGGRPPAQIIAFGPGLTMDGIALAAP
jgi:alkylresorcinol/alkylpyrone synthase